ncbi:acidobacterial duplicated orphan permease [Micrococcus luteus]|uniref:ABC transporter permease n=1 Tax=Micrococcus luteus TaxID=1270 RepID=UPI000E086698|nr:ABC transporter permease [Micrococcus luteus]STY73993.1 acidobacterial duplicated orphan permease [Micrococcus luteus]
MFLALRDLRFATGRFALMGSVVALISLLLVMLSGLTAGLGGQNTAAIDRLGEQGVQRLVFGGAADQEPTASFTQSEFTVAQRDAWAATDGVASVEPLGVSQGRAIGLEHPVDTDPQGRADVSGEPTTGVATTAFIGLTPGGSDAPAGVEPGQIVLSQDVADSLHAQAGDAVAVSGFVYTVADVVPTEYYSHSPVTWLALEDWNAISHTADDAVLGTAGLVRFDADADADVDAVGAAGDEAAGTVAETVKGSYAALPSYRSENGSLMTMQGFLYGISALVVIAFLSIWTVQRTRDIAVLKALGGSNAWVLKDSLAQAAFVLVGGVAVGTGLAAVIGAFAGRAVPFELSWATTAVPAAGVLVLGMLAAVVAVFRVTRIDPLVALGGN